MKVIVDANIVFSGILNTNGTIGDLLINSYRLIDFIAPDFLRVEIREHYDRLVEISMLTLSEVIEAEFQVCKDIKFISEEQVSLVNWESAFELVKSIDPKDIHYVAFSKQFNRKIWSGDRKLIHGLEMKGYKDLIRTDELYRIREEIKLKQARQRRRK